MQKSYFFAVLAFVGILTFASCTEDATSSLIPQQTAGSVLRLQTRSVDAAIAQTSIYLFGADGQCAALLQPDDNGDYISARLPAGTYTVCAAGGADLSLFNMPTADEAAATTLITPASGQPVGDLLMASSSVTLNDGEEKTLDLTLQRRVLEISTVTIRQVPLSVTAVGVTLSPLYEGVMLNGTLPTSATASCTISLTQTSDGVWQSSAPQLVFPSSAALVVTVSFTVSGSDVPATYTYTMTDALEANYKYNIEGTYTEPLGVVLKGSVVAQAWNETPRAIEFDFDESNAADADDPATPAVPGDAPVAGSTYLGYYVVSVNTAARTAVLASFQERTFFTSDAAVTTFMQGLDKPEGASGEWRIPTVTECSIYMSDPQVDISFDQPHLCTEESVLYRMTYEYVSGERVFKSKYAITGSITGGEYLSPVIDIAY